MEVIYRSILILKNEKLINLLTAYVWQMKEYNKDAAIPDYL